MRIFFSAGEPSGDVHTAHLIEEISRRRRDVRFEGFGGPNMREAGCELLYPLTDLAVMGFKAVIPLLGRFYLLVQQAKRRLESHRPDAVVLVDFPGFNWHIARHARRLGIPVFYYLAPQIWAWASWRVKRMQRDVDHVLCSLPFEQSWYAERGVEARYVGHPIFDEISAQSLDHGFIESRRSKRPVLGVLPGSRNSEVKNNWPNQVQVLQNLRRRLPDMRFEVACYKESHREFCREYAARYLQDFPIEYLVGKTPEIIELADACLMVSGSVSLELLARTTPAVVMYHTSWSMFHFGLWALECDYMSLPNLMAQRELMPEFVMPGKRSRAWNSQIANELYAWLTDESELEHRRTQLRQLYDKVRVAGAIQSAANAILDTMTQTTLKAA